MTIKQETILGVSAITIAALFVCMIPGCLEARRKSEETRKTLINVSERLANHVDENGDFVEENPEEKDAYGHSLRAVYSKGEVFRTVRVESAGLDGKFDTDDDVHFERSVGIKHASKAVEKYLGDVTRSQFREAIKGIKEGVKGDK